VVCGAGSDNTLTVENALSSGTFFGTGAATDQLVLGNFDNSIIVNGIETVTGGTANDIISVTGSTGAVINGGDGLDNLTGGDGADTITGGTGDDIYNASKGADVYDAGSDGSNDTLQFLLTDHMADFVHDSNNLTIEFDRADDTTHTLTVTDHFNGSDLAQVTMDIEENGTLITRIMSTGISATAAVNTILAGTTGADTLTGNTGDDVLFGADGVDTLIGGGGNDFFDGGAGADIITGGTGDDVYYVSDGHDTITTGGGQDRLLFESDMHVAGAVLSGSGNLTIEYDNEFGTTDFVTISGHVSGDALYEVTFDIDEDGTVETYRVATTDTAPTAEGALIAGTSAAETLSGGAGNDVLFGEGLGDRLIGGDGDDFLDGGDGDDTLEGGAGNDIFYAADGDDTVTAGSGVDTLAIDHDLDLNNVIFDGTDVTFNMEDDFGGTHSVLIDGHSTDALEQVQADLDFDGTSELYKFAVSTDDITSATEDYLVAGTTGVDTITGGSGNDVIIGNAGADTLNGGNGDDWFDGGAGADTINGGTGSDTVSFHNAETAVVIDLSGGTDTALFNSETDTLTGIENMEGGLAGDTLIGDTNDNTFLGLEGADTMTGGTGSDVFIYESQEDTGIGTGNYDVITDFDAGTNSTAVDQIDISGFVVGNFSFVGTSAFSGSGDASARFTDSSKILEIDADGDAVSDMEIELQNVSIGNLDDSDFDTGLG